MEKGTHQELENREWKNYWIKKHITGVLKEEEDIKKNVENH